MFYKKNYTFAFLRFCILNKCEIQYSYSFEHISHFVKDEEDYSNSYKRQFPHKIVGGF